MKLKSFLTLAACGLLMTACSSEEPAQNQPNANEGNYRMAISLNFGEGTRGYEVGDAEENAVKDIAVAIFQELNGAIKCFEVNSVDVPTLTNGTGAIDKTGTTFIDTKIEPGDAGTYYALAIVNYKDNGVGLPAIGQTYSDWANSLQGAANIGNATDGFFMTNSLQGATVDALTTLAPINTANIVKSTTNNPSFTAPAATIYVERAAVKVTVAYTASAVENCSLTEAELAAWNVDITGNKFYTVHQYTHGTFTEPSWFFMNDGFRFMWANTAADAWTALTAINGDKDAAQYCVENCMTAKEMRQHRTTRVVLKVNFAPTSAGMEGYAAGNDFYKYNNQYYTAEKLEELTGVDTTALTFAADGTVSVTGVGTITKFANGMSYYVVRLRHFADNVNDDLKLADGWDGDFNKYTDGQTGRYGVVRNNWYEVNVTKIKGVGSPVIPAAPSTLSDDPVEVASENYIEYSVNILKWYKHSQDAEF